MDVVPHETELIAILAVGLSAAFLGGLVARRLGLSAIIGYLLAGVALGPFTPRLRRQCPARSPACGGWGHPPHVRCRHSILDPAFLVAEVGRILAVVAIIMIAKAAALVLVPCSAERRRRGW
jgi:predicted Kef-type K+ transport protein